MLDTILMPLISFLATLLEFGYGLTGNYGLAIIVLSILVNIILLPAYMLAEHLQKKEQLIRNAMQDKLQEIAQCFQGQERFMMTQTLYRLHGYHPIMGLRSLLSLLIQIPFFFAAYQLLKHYDPLIGTSFLFIGDLSLADGLFPLGRYAINLLPIIMTAINIMAAQIYTARTNPRTLISSLNMALIFLVLLYTSPAALVLYWTANNLFSLGKNMLLAGRRGKLETALPIHRALAVHIRQWLGKVNRTIQTVLGLWCFAIYTMASFLLSPYNPKYDVVPNILLGIGICALVISSYVLLLSYHIKQRESSKLSFCMMLIHVACTICGGIMLLIYAYIPAEKIEITVILFRFLSYFLLALPNALWLPYFIRMIYRYHKADSMHKVGRVRQKRTSIIQLCTIIASLSATALLLFLALPANMYQNVPNEFDLSFFNIVMHNLPYILIMVCGGLGMYILAPRIIKPWLQFCIVAASLLLLCYALIIPFELGPMDHFTLMFPMNIAPEYFVYLIEGLGIALSMILLYTALKRYRIQLLTIMLLFNVVVVLRLGSFGLWYRARNVARSVENTEQSADYQDGILPPGMFAFSQEKQNIVLILLDMANGGYMQRALEDKPSLSQIYKDFTWYPNTLSISTYTVPSKPSMLAGWNYAPENIAVVPGNTLAEKILDAQHLLFRTFTQHQYQIGVTGEYFGYDVSQCTVLKETNIACLNHKDQAIAGHWLAHNADNSRLESDFSREHTFSLINLSGLLRSVPVLLKHSVYNNGTWNLNLKNAVGYMAALAEWSLFDSLESLSSIRDEDHVEDHARNGTFTFIHSNITHRPYALDSSCQLRRTEFPDPIANNDFGGDASYFSFRCSMESLAAWMKWLQEHDAYDNTKIIIVSDHGNDVAEDPMNINNIAPDMMGRAHTYAFSRSHALLMIKEPFQSNKHPSQLQIDHRFLSNADTAAIIYHSLEGYVPPENSHPDDLHDPTKITPPPSRSLPVYHTNTFHWTKLVHNKIAFPLEDKYIVTDNIFEKENWKKIK